MNNQSLAIYENKGALALVPDMAELQSVLQELSDMNSFPYGRIKMASGGAKVFQVFEPGDEDDDVQSTQEISAIILMSNLCNAYWPSSISDGGDKTPVCSSIDGVTGIETESGECRACKTCPHNQFGSDSKGGKGKACKNMRRLYLLRPESGDLLPLIFTLPPTSIGAYDKYRAKVALKYKGNMHAVITKITLKTQKNATGTVYSTAAFEAVERLSPQDAQRVFAYAQAFKSSASQVGINEDDYATGSAQEDVYPRAAAQNMHDAQAPQDRADVTPDMGNIDEDGLPEDLFNEA